MDDAAAPVSSALDWEHSSPWAKGAAAGAVPLRSNRSADVVVVGAGIAGLLTATMLSRRGLRVLVLDRHGIGGVATANTTAKISALQGTGIRSIRSHRGPATAADYAAAQVHAVDGIQGLITELDIECALTPASAYTYATDEDGVAQAREEYEHAHEAGLPVRWVTDTELPFEIKGAVRLDDQAHFDPGAFCAGLARHLGTDCLVGDTAVVSVHEDVGGCTVVTADGVQVSAGHVVVATQAPIVDPGFLVNRCAPRQSYALAARVAGPVPQGMYLSCDEQVRSLRPALVDGREAVVVGGEGHDMGDSEATPDRWRALEAWTVEHFGAAEVTHRWATHDLVPTDRVPFIGPLVRGAERRWVATGFAKWGMTNAYVAAHLIAEAMEGRATPWTSAFDSTRVAASVTTELAPIVRSSVTHLVVDRLTRRTEPRCTHQGCVLRADDALGTWDCPCHGSRFERDGRVIQGPATAPLEMPAPENEESSA